MVNRNHLVLRAMRDKNSFSCQWFLFNNVFQAGRDKPGQYTHLADSRGIEQGQCVDHCCTLTESHQVEFSRVQINGGRVLVNKSNQRFNPRLRSEEHTSELQSRLHLLCRLLP